MSAARNKGDDPLMRALGVAGIAWGSAILTAGSSIWRRLDGQAPTQGDQIALRFLGARHVATGTIQVLFPGRLQRLKIGIDVIQAATMVGLGALDPPRRRPALVTAAVALASAAAGMAIRERSSRDSPSSS